MNPSLQSDVIIVGSGASGANAAVPLVEAGLRVTMLDFGNVDERYAPLIPKDGFQQIRESCGEQHRFFLGDAFEGIPLGEVRVGAQLTPPRLHITRGAEEMLPVAADDFQAAQSLALGGLGAGWGAAAFPFRDSDLEGFPIREADLAAEYEVVSRRIGISGAQDDLYNLYGESESLLPAAEIDANAEALYRSYEGRRAKLNGAGFFMGRPRLAFASRETAGRGPCGYTDMDFWADSDRSVYRPQFTVDELRRSPNFEYRAGWLVKEYAEVGGGEVEVIAVPKGGGEAAKFRARGLVLAAGAINSARVVLRSLGRIGEPVPLVCNPYTYVPVINLRMIGRKSRDRRHSLSQLCAFAMKGERVESVAQYYTYRSLLTFKLLKESPLPLREGIRVMRALEPLFGILGIHQADAPSPLRTMRLEGRGDGDALRIDFAYSAAEQARHRATEREMIARFRSLGCLPLKVIHPGHGSSIHYAGTLPMRETPGPLECDRAGRLGGAGRVWLADSAGFPYLPAKGLTFAMMANASRVGRILAETLRGETPSKDSRFRDH